MALPTTTSTSSTAKLVDKANPAKIRVQLGGSYGPSLSSHHDEPVAKRPRTGGAFSGFNAQLPPPKRDANQGPAAAPKPAARKVFSLKTGAEPAFSRESDAELRQFFAEQDSSRPDGAAVDDSAIPDIPKPTAITATTSTSSTTTIPTNAFMFKPLSVARPKNSRTKPKKQPTNGSVARGTATTTAGASSSLPELKELPPPPAKKISLFSSVDTDPDPDPDPVLHDSSLNTDYNPPPQTLSSIADDLNLSAADKRQLFGRGHGSNGTALAITNFNTDHEYAANQELIAKGDQVQHNPVRAIAPGKHSLRQLVSVAQGQKDALEDSFAIGKRNKKEAGSKYGW
ncbi:hypothetical protein DV737_g5735, partial [Chaetothyriales sp. CBS 132003]